MSSLAPSRRALLCFALLTCLASTTAASPLLQLTLDNFHKKNGTIDHPHDDGLVYDGFPRAASMVGWISIACWIVVYTPQLALSYYQQSGEGLSLIFLGIWLAGDATNLLGAIWQDLLSTMIILAVYYSLCDIILIGQVFYYRRKRALYPELYTTSPSESLTIPHETDPLLSSFSAHAPSEREPTRRLRRIRDVVSYLGGFVLVLLVGFAAWRLSRDVPKGRKEAVWDTKAQIVGWISAFLYLGSRLPQITKNMETKCQGLSLLMFAFSVAGNVTYVASILFKSVSPSYLLVNASWLVGSGGTIFLDFIVLGQFWYYSSARKAEAKIFADDENLVDDEA